MLTAGHSVASTEQYFVSDSSMARCTFFSSSALEVVDDLHGDEAFRVLVGPLAADLDAQVLERLTHLLQDRYDVHACAAGQGDGEQLHGRRPLSGLVQPGRHVQALVGRGAREQQTLLLPAHDHGPLVAMLSLASSTGGARGRLRCLHRCTVR